MQQPPNDQPDWQHPQYYQQQPQYPQPNYPQQSSQLNWPPQQSGQLPPQYTQYPQPPYQQTGPGMPLPQWEQPYQQPGMPPQYPMPPQQPPRRAGRLPVWTILLVIAIVVCAVAGAFYGVSNSSNTTTATSSIPNQPSVQSESDYKASTTLTTVDNLDKNGNADKGKDVHFTCKILRFVKDDSGNTVGANVGSPNTYSSAIPQIVFPSGTDITLLNEGDIVEVWGTDAGVFSGQNAFGATIQEVGITALYMNDQTTGYQTH